VSSGIDYDLLSVLQGKPHPLLNIMDDVEKQIRECPWEWTAEVMSQARSAHHLLDMAQVPRGRGCSSDLDSRVYLAVTELIGLRRRVEQAPAGDRAPGDSGAYVPAAGIDPATSAFSEQRSSI
jgi:hypothetical protein